MSSDKTEYYRAKLDALYQIILSLRPSSSDKDFEEFGSHFAPECTVYLKSMNMHRMPGISRHEAIEDMKEVLEKMHIEDRQVLHFTLAADGRTTFCETKQRINVMGEIIEPYFETEIARFDEQGLIEELKLYSCWSPIVRIVQDKTGKGPYAEGERREQFEAYVKSVAMNKIQKRRARMDAAKAEEANNGINGDCCS